MNQEQPQHKTDTVGSVRLDGFWSHWKSVGVRLSAEQQPAEIRWVQAVPARQAADTPGAVDTWQWRPPRCHSPSSVPPPFIAILFQVAEKLRLRGVPVATLLSFALFVGVLGLCRFALAPSWPPGAQTSSPGGKPLVKPSLQVPRPCRHREQEQEQGLEQTEQFLLSGRPHQLESFALLQETLQI